MTLPCRGASQRPEFEGVARRKTQTYSVRDPFEIAAGAFRRANKRSSSEAVAHQKMRHAPMLVSTCSFAAFSFRHRAPL
jgi:hypothetical protein